MAFTNKQFQDMLREGIKSKKSAQRIAADERRKEYQKGLDRERAARAAARPKPEKKGIPVVPITDWSEKSKLTRQAHYDRGEYKWELAGKDVADEEQAKDWFKRRAGPRSEERSKSLYFMGSDVPLGMPHLARDPDKGYYFYYKSPMF